MERFLDFIKKHRRGLIASAVIIVLLIVAFVGFKLLVKVGNPKYFYNYMHDAAGSREAEYFPEHEAGADSSAPYAVRETSPSEHKVVEKLKVSRARKGMNLLSQEELASLPASVYWEGDYSDSFERSEKIDFAADSVTKPYTDRGMLTFRGDYARNSTSVGKSEVKEEKLDKKWEYATGKILKGNGSDYWSGNGWTGQPILMRWDRDVKETMNMYESAKKKDGLVEVIYPGMDGSIRFLDLETGEETRPTIYVGMTFKGTASLYPDGTPLLFCGSGDAQTGMFGENVSQRFYIYSLIDGSLLYQGGYDSDVAPRVWHAYDSSPVIDPVTDTLIQPGENGVIYTMKLQTKYDREAGTLSVHPSSLTEYTFTIEDKYREGGYLWGSECSAAAFGGYLYLGDNAGTFYCLDLNTMKMVWLQELNEDINSSPILDFDGDSKYVYVATTLKYNYDAHSMGDACIYKLNAMTGEIVWKKPYNVHTVKGYAGGVLSTGALGEGKISDYIIYSISKTPGLEEGYLTALNRKDGREAWRIELDMYSWSSTVLTYTGDGRAYIIQGCQNGDLLLIDAEKGIIRSRLNFGSAIEATPVVYGNDIVLATRSERIFGVRLK